jgi:NTE family protein
MSGEIPRRSAPTRVALALGSGGARGYAHIGVIEELRARGYEIVGVAGSSMGAVVGGLHAAGRLDEFTEWAKSLTQRTILRHGETICSPPLGYSCLLQNLDGRR